MSILVGVGSSQKSKASFAVEEAFQQAIQPLDNKPPSFISLFSSPTTYNQEELVTTLKEKAPKSVIIGCSTSGEISSAGASDKSVAIMAIYSDTVKFIPGKGCNIKEGERVAGKALAEDIMTKAGGSKPTAALILPDGLAGNGADIVRGILDVYGQDFRLAGGAAGDDFLFKQTYEYYGNKVVSGCVVGVGLYGDFKYGIGVKHGWIPIGNPRKVTKSKSNIVYELDGEPAIKMYQDQFGEDKEVVSPQEPLARLAITYPLGIVIPGKDEYLIRDPITVDKTGAITCAAEIPEGSEVYIMIGSQNEAIDAAQDAAQQALDQLEGAQPKAIFLFNCIARKKLLMTRKQDEIDRIRKVLGEDVPIIGFYTYGEQAPLGGSIATCSFHNETDVLFVLGE